MNKGKYIGTITKEDLKDLPYSKKFVWWKLLNCIGRVLPCDIGKRVYETNGVYQVENNAQFLKRNT